MTPDDRERKRSRRAFFQSGADQFARFLGELVSGNAPPVRKAPPPRPLRPPGALDEGEFLRTCQRSMECVKACPANAIQPYRGSDAQKRGTPHIVPSMSPCVVCDDLACMDACPSGALVPLPRDAIQIGFATVDHDRCTRRHDGGVCRTCVDVCPIGTSALMVNPNDLLEVLAGCVGCGVCEFHCPTRPRAIRVLP
ncbi:MAG: 4Fe-4S dicluster domain-containing protein [Planctomycetes bacterium]|nr:4Fe-4S dicluster domain-containing protein [Planctomycetota bacterium]